MAASKNFVGMKFFMFQGNTKGIYTHRPLDLISEITALGFTFLKGELVQTPGVLKYIVLLHWTQQGQTSDMNQSRQSLCKRYFLVKHLRGSRDVLQIQNPFNSL